jgi:hypothetical protein
MRMPMPASELRKISIGWWEYKPERTASALYDYALGLEMYQYARRTRNLVMYRLVMGEEPPLQLGLWMSRKAASTVGGLGSNYTKPYSNVISNACSVLENRIGTLQPFVQLSPQDVSAKVRFACQDATDFIDGTLDMNRYFWTSRVAFKDLFTFGMAFVKVSPSWDEKEIVIERVLPDEILVDEISAAICPPSNLIQRRYMSRSDVWAMFGGEDERTDTAIRTAPSAFLNAARSQIADDYVCLLEAWKLPDITGAPGRHVLVLQNRLLVDEPWKRTRFPFAVARWQTAMMNYYTPGGAFIMAPYQMEINTKDERIRACEQAVAYPGWLAQSGSGVTAATMGARPNALYKYDGVKPEPVLPQAVRPETYADRETWEKRAYAAVGITGQQVQGQKQAGVNAGVALRLMVDYEDERNKSLTITLEQLCGDVGELVLDVAEEIKPTVVTGGVRSRKIKWSEIVAQAGRESWKLKPFPINALSVTPAEKAQQIEDWYANGEIDRRAYFRLQNLPDLSSYARLSTASDDLVEQTLDEIVRTGKYLPPSPTYDVLPSALKVAQARWNLEKRYGTEVKVLRQVQKFMQVIADMMAHPNGQMMQPTPELASAPGLGPAAIAPSQLPVGQQLPAPSPLQIAPPVGPPQQLAA